MSEHNDAWQLTNRDKRSIALDLKAPDAMDVLTRLVQWADVVVINFPPKVKEKLGLTYEAGAPLNPRLIYADVTGYGANGPEADKPGFDITAYWARTGLMQVTRDAGSAQTLPIPGIGDHATASTLYSAIVTGLYRREKTGNGSHVTTSLIAEGAWAAATWIEGGLNGAKFYGPHNRKTPPNALINPYRTADDRWLLLVLPQSKDWKGFVHAMRLPGLLDDPRFAGERDRAANTAALVEILDDQFATESLAHWKKTFDEARVIYGVVQIADEIVNDRQIYENDIFVPLVSLSRFDAVGELMGNLLGDLNLSGLAREDVLHFPVSDASGGALRFAARRAAHRGRLPQPQNVAATQTPLKFRAHIRGQQHGLPNCRMEPGCESFPIVPPFLSSL